MDQRAKGLSPNVILAMMVATATVTAAALIPIKGPHDGDFNSFFLWMNAVRSGGLASISGEFSEYTPPYIYLLYLASKIEPWVGTIAAVKLINAPFILSAVAGIGAIVYRVTADADRAKIATAVTTICPSLLLNAFGYGQCDTIFTSFLIWFAYFAIADRPVIAAVMFGLAVSFKVWATIVSPLIIVLLVWRRMKLWHLFIIPAVYVLMMVPAAIAGRPWTDLLMVYSRQPALIQQLSMNAPNPWWCLEKIVDYRTGVIIGLGAGLLAWMAIAARALRLPSTAVAILLIAAVSAAVIPYVLPKMTARYFFVADMLTIALAFVRPRLWPAAVLIQIGSLVASMSYFFAWWGTAGLAFVPMTFGVGLLIYEYLTADAGRPQESSPRLST